MLGELQRGSLKEGDRVKLVARTDESAVWTGTVTLVDYENPSQGSDTDRNMGIASDEMSTASKYPFYVALDSTAGLMMGQHLYVELDTGNDAPGGGISGAFLCYNEDGTAYVWAEKGGKLEKRAVTLGEYDPMTERYRRALAGIDRMLARECDTVVELAAGRRIVHKGVLPF